MLSVRVNNIKVEVPEGHADIVLPAGLGTLHLNEQTIASDQITQQALFLDTNLVDIVVAEAVADRHGDPCQGAQQPPEERLPGWIGGGGYVAEPGAKQDHNGEGAVEPGTKLQHAFNIDCFVTEGDDPGPGKDNLVAQWFDGNGKEHSSFKLLVLEDARCTNDPAIGAGKPSDAPETVEGSGLGVCRSQGAETAVEVEVEFRFSDAGESGRNDRAFIDTNIVPGQNTPDELALICDYESEGRLDGGNHQAHTR